MDDSIPLKLFTLVCMQLSHVMCICPSNVLHTLLDSMYDYAIKRKVRQSMNQIHITSSCRDQSPFLIFVAFIG